MWNCGPLIPLSPVDTSGDTAADVVSVGEELMVDLDRPVSGLGSRELVAALKQAEREYRATYARILELTSQAQQRGVYLE